MDANCIFCKIVAGELPSAKVYEDARVLAFMNLQQKNPGHTLVIPKSHVVNIYDISEDTAADVARVAVRIGKALKQRFRPDGVNTLQNSERAAMQSVMHYHVHVIPRYFGDDLFEIWDSPPASGEELNTNAGRLREALADLNL